MALLPRNRNISVPSTHSWVTWILLAALTLESTAAAQPTFWERVNAASARGVNLVRITLVATDEQMEQLRLAREAVEQALEPPMEEERFWHRKLELLKDPRAALDLRRSFENVIRVVHLSKYFENPWLRELIVSAATMFGITHGSEAISGAALGVYFTFWAIVALTQTDLPTASIHGGLALSFFGMALPGLYDAFCYVGAGMLFLRPTRYAFNESRKFVIHIGGDVGKRVGVPGVMAAILEKASARQKLEEALRSPDLVPFVEFEFTDDELLNVVHRDEHGRELFHLRFVPYEQDALELVEARFGLNTFAATDYSEIEPLLSPYGWNVQGAVRQIHKLASKNKIELLEHEKTFVASVRQQGDTLSVGFRKHAVRVHAAPSLRPEYRWMNPMNIVRTCSALLAGRSGIAGNR
jgi:hypothetical protein